MGSPQTLHASNAFELDGWCIFTRLAILMLYTHGICVNWSRRTFFGIAPVAFQCLDIFLWEEYTAGGEVDLIAVNPWYLGDDSCLGNSPWSVSNREVVWLSSGGFLKWGYPWIIHSKYSNDIFLCKPSILGYPNLWKPSLDVWQVTLQMKLTEVESFLAAKVQDEVWQPWHAARV